MRILIADDDPVFRALLTHTMTLWGFDPEVAEDGTSADAILRSPTRPRLAILDWEMPGLDGPEICRRCASRVSTNPTYCILLTIHTSSADISKGLEAGAHDFIPKPMHHLMLRRRLAVWRRLIELEVAHRAEPLALEKHSLVRSRSAYAS